MRILRFFLIIGLFMVCALLNAQSNTLEVVCFVESMDGDPIEAAKAEIFRGGNKVSTVNADSKGKLNFKLDFNQEYKILVSKGGMIQKRIDFKTGIEVDQERNLKKEFAMTLVESCDGADVSVFSEPVDIITYDNGFGNFVSDQSHFEKMQSRFANAYRSIDKCKEDKFADKKAEANQQFTQGNYDQAIALYEEALEIFPNDGATKRQISQANKNIEKNNAAAQRYTEVIAEADMLLAQSNLTGAKAKFAEAQKLQPGEAYPQQKITEITNTIAAQQAALQQQQQTNAEYDSYIKQGNSAMAAKNFPLAQQMFEQAAALKPNETFASQKIAEAQSALAMQQQAAAESDRINAEYNDAMALAATAMQQGEYVTAQTHYQAAVVLKPSESLPRQKINEAQKLEAQKQQQLLAAQNAEVERQYNDAITQADALLAQKKYPESITAYEQAIAIKPTDKYSQKQIVKINNLIIEEEQSKLAAVEQQYTQAMTLGDSKKLNREYEAAISAYQQALVAKPSDASATARIAESEKLLADKNRLEKDEAEKRANYTSLLQEGDSYFTSNDFTNSKSKYEQASQLYPSEQYPKNRIAEIENIVAKAATRAEYNAVIAEADGLFNQESWDAAKQKYNQAQQVLPSESYPRQRINEINQKVSNSALAAIEAEYNELLGQAETQIVSKNYDAAKATLAEAQKVMPENPFPQRRINEINQLISDETKNAIQTKYNDLTTKAEQEVNNQNFNQAKSLLAEAMTILPENPYPQNRINEINQMIDEMASQSKQDNYNSIIAEGDTYFGNKDYSNAKAAYSRALVAMPGESYPQQKINEINQLVSDIARQKVVDDYNEAVREADVAFEQNNLAQASQLYRTALSIMPEQNYPQKQLNAISALLTEQAKAESDVAAVDNEYNAVVALADRYFSDKNYPLAISEYQKALGIKPSEAYPNQQIQKINEQIASNRQLAAEQSEKERMFADNIAKADEQFKAKNYTAASSSYNEALIYKPGNAHATSQIQRINAMLNEADASKNREEQKKQRFDSHIAKGDQLYADKKFKESKSSYLAALEVIPGQEYPRAQIRKIDEKLRIIAANQANARVVTTVSTAPATTSTNSKKSLDSDKFTSENERKKYLEDLKNKYGSGVTKEVFQENGKTTTRYVVVRNGEVNEYREIRFKWGGAQYTVNGKATNSFYLNSQVKPRDGENFNEINN